MLPQVTAPNRARPNAQQYVAIIDEADATDGTVGSVLATIQTRFPHGQSDIERAWGDADRYARAAKKQNPRLRYRVEWLREFLEPGAAVDSRVHLTTNFSKFLRPR